MSYKKNYYFILIAFCAFILSCSKDEDRAVWVVRFDLKTKKNVKKIVRNSKAAGFNMIIAQVYGRGDAYYNSFIAPRTEVLEDQPADYDPLKTMVVESRNEGLKIHAWVNTFYIWRGVKKEDPETYPKSEKHIVRTHPEWIIKDSSGRRLDDYDENARKLNWIEGLYADPSNLEYREYFMSICKEIVQRYDIDGLHLDFVRYPGTSFGYNDKAISDFLSMYSVNPFDLTQAFTSPIPEKFISKDLSIAARWEYYYHSLWIELKSNYITSLVADLKKELDETSKNLNGKKVILSAAVFPDRNTAYFSKSQDWGRWLDEGYLDMVMPMAYYGSKERVLNQIYNVKKKAGDKKVLAGLGVYTKSDNTIKKEIHTLRKMNIDGFSFFSYGGMIPGAGFSKEYTDIKSVRRKIFTPYVDIFKDDKLKAPPDYSLDRYRRDYDRIDVKEAHIKLYNDLLSSAREKGIKAERNEVDKFLSCLKKQFYSGDDYQSYLKRLNIDEEILKGSLYDDITVFKFITETIYPLIEIKDDEPVTIPKVADYQLFYRYVHPKDSEEKRKKEKSMIDRAYKKLARGEDFAELAKKYSRSATASSGGYYKNKYYDELDDVSDIIFSLKEGETTKVLTRPSGFAIYRINEFYPETEMLYKDVSNSMKNIVFYNKLKDSLMSFGESL